MTRRGSAELVDAEYVELGKGYESISRDALQDRRLSFKARGVMSYLKSKPPKWKTNTQAIADDSDKDGYEAVNTGIRELEDAGYFARLKRQGAGGRWEWLWIYSDDPRAVAVRKARWQEVTGKESPHRGPRRAEPPTPDVETPGQTGSGFPVPGSPVPGGSVPGSPVPGKPPNKKEIKRRDQEREEGGESVEPVTTAPPEPAAPPPPLPKADWQKPETWHCGEHLAAVLDDPGFDVPSCGRCARVKDWARPQYAAWSTAGEAAAETSAETAARLERECRWHDSALHVIDPATGGPFAPVWKCDHRTPPETVAAELARRESEREPVPLATSGRAAAREIYQGPRSQPARRRGPGRGGRAPASTGTDGLEAAVAANDPENVTP